MYKISSIVSVVAAVIAALSGCIVWWSGSIISLKQENKIFALETEQRIKRPTIFSQEVVSKNIVEGDVFVHQYLVSINSPVVHAPLYTRINFQLENGGIERIGEMQINDRDGGVRQVEGADVSYLNTLYTLRTNRRLGENEAIIFSLQPF